VKKLLLTLMLAVVSSSAMAEWVEVGSNEYDLEYQIDENQTNIYELESQINDNKSEIDNLRD
jgi:cell division protein FtsL